MNSEEMTKPIPPSPDRVDRVNRFGPAVLVTIAALAALHFCLGKLLLQVGVVESLLSPSGAGLELLAALAYMALRVGLLLLAPPVAAAIVAGMIWKGLQRRRLRRAQPKPGFASEP